MTKKTYTCKQLHDVIKRTRIDSSKSHDVAWNFFLKHLNVAAGNKSASSGEYSRNEIIQAFHAIDVTPMYVMTVLRMLDEK